MTYAAQTVALTRMAAAEAAITTFQSTAAAAATAPLGGIDDLGDPGRTRYILLVTLLAGCSEPTPAPLSREGQIPPNQSPCSPDSQSPYCQHQALVLSEMQDMRAEGHHSDQALFGIGIGAALLFGLAVGYLFGRRSGKRSERRRVEALQNPPQPPPATTKTDGAPKVG